MSALGRWLRRGPSRPTFRALAESHDTALREAESARRRAFSRKDRMTEEARATLQFRYWARLSWWQRLRTKVEDVYVSDQDVNAVVLAWMNVDPSWLEHVGDEQFLSRLTSMYAGSARVAAERERQPRGSDTPEVMDETTQMILLHLRNLHR